MKEVFLKCNLCGSNGVDVNDQTYVFALREVVDDDGNCCFKLEDPKEYDSDMHICVSCLNRFENLFSEPDEQGD